MGNARQAVHRGQREEEGDDAHTGGHHVVLILIHVVAYQCLATFQIPSALTVGYSRWLGQIINLYYIAIKQVRTYLC